MSNIGLDLSVSREENERREEKSKGMRQDMKMRGSKRENGKRNWKDTGRNWRKKGILK